MAQVAQTINIECELCIVSNICSNMNTNGSNGGSASNRSSSEAGATRRFSFPPKVLMTKLVTPGPGPWGDRDFIDHYGRVPPPNIYSREDWVVFYEFKRDIMQAKNEGKIFEMDDEQRSCYEEMLDEVARWQELNRQELAAVRTSHPVRSNSSTRTQGHRR